MVPATIATEHYVKTADGWRIASMQADSVHSSQHNSFVHPGRESMTRSLATRALMGAIAAVALAVAAGAAVTPPAHAAEKAAKSGQAWSDLDRLVATEEIRQLKSRYFIAADAGDWKGYQAIFTPDAKLDLGMKSPDGKPLETPADVAGFLESIMKDLRTQHHGHNFVVNFTSPTEAEGRWDYEVWSWYTGAGKAPTPNQHFWGQYHEHYTKTKDGWRISAMKGTPVHAGD
jgi:ketosteroid isomerase-like protein